MISQYTDDELSIASPNGKIKLQFSLNQVGSPTYAVSYNKVNIINPSKLGFTFKNDKSLLSNFKINTIEKSEVNDTWFPVWGEKSVITNHYKELIVHLYEGEGSEMRMMDLVFRVYNDGVGFRYVLPEQDHLKEFVIMSENTEFQLTDNHTSWWIENDWNSYEKLYQNTPLSNIKEASTPLTMKTKTGIHLSIHEAALVNYAEMALTKTVGNTLISSLCPWPDGTKVKSQAPLKTPWRTIQIGDDAGDLIESDLILNLNDPSVIEDTSWIKPMKYVGIWWEMHIDQSTWSSGDAHGATTDNAKAYIDFAYEYLVTDKQPIGLLVEGWNMGWDGNWTENGNLFDFTTPYPDFDLEEVVNYANERNVHYIMHNETSGAIVNYENQMDEAYALYQSLGIHAIKSGYVADNGMVDPIGQNHHGQYMVNHYLNAVKKAAEYQIMINTHEPIKDTGLLSICLYKNIIRDRLIYPRLC